MDDIFRKRELVKQAYPTKAWQTKVSAMTDSQVVAIFLRLRRQGKV
jgi:hypothetical protein